MAFIDTISASWVTGEAFAMYDRQQKHYGYVPDYATVFSHRPEVMRRWADLLAALKRPMDRRRFELATFAAAVTLKSTLCTLAHGKALLQFFSAALRDPGRGHAGRLSGLLYRLKRPVPRSHT